MKRENVFQAVRGQRGSVMVFVLFTIIFLLVMGGLAVDYAYVFTVQNELQRSMDAAALAAAGKLTFNSTVFPTVRQFAQNFAQKNAFHQGSITLAANNANDVTTYDAQNPPYGDIVLGIWDPSKPVGVGSGFRFEPSTSGSTVNAVMCRYKTAVPTSLFRLWGITTPVIGATAFAVSNPPSTPPVSGCTFPIALSMCPFSTNNIFTANGCGKTVKFTTSNGQADSTNTAAWVDLTGTGTNASTIQTEVNNAGNAAPGAACNPAPA